MPGYDVIVAGGSVSGLLAAREAAAGGLSVAVLEEDSEIGTPEHCGGLVSIAGIRNIGIVPDASAVENTKIARAKILSPSSGFEISAEKQKVMVLDRRAFDKQIAFQAQKLGAEIKVKCAMRSFSKKEDDGPTYIVKTSEGDLVCKYFVDARGVASIIARNREGVLQSAQYEVYAPWIERDTIEVAFDNQRYPGFFAWIIPTAQGSGKVGVAGRGINAASALQSYIDGKGKCSIVRKVYASIWVNGPMENLVSDRMIIVGDAAGQSKPTTAGGIYTCGMGGVLAGRAVAEAARKNDDRLLAQYEKDWRSMFGAEFEKMLLARKLLERLDNKAIDELFSAVPPEKIEEASASGDFDFHSAALAKILGAKSATRMAKALLGNEIRRLIDIS
ncbi:Geranylgeranyl reductase family protein [Candidatus Nitrososphaera gargensis Ga9.2]|uniref:Geranylgeranyl reductase family protein n=1 Tax=Nitrososphaera gargensis (strain Ga9.2) TaxID=1237085 RepID=K0IKB9_NITGG|nr:NAD(P)/FAD-dependent oxidoreductase [Candidatus Nitrososphaera gargensis]AFU58807.1 Geranylgeranyl reductase family protein [Candidatus Nitrososphaera gargensis Ga9.2]